MTSHHSLYSEPRNKTYIAILMYFLVSLGGIVVDIIVPSLPHIQNAFSTSETLIQWSFTAAMLGFGFGQMVAGFIVDAYGRKIPMVLGALCLVIALILPLFAPNIETLIMWRLLQGLAVSFVCVGGRAVVKDIYDGAQYLKAVNWITISFAMGITLSPFIGGYIESLYGWKGVFTILAAWVSLGLILLWFTFTETHKERHPLRKTSMVSNLSELLLNHSFQRIAIICGIFYSILPAFNTVSPFIIQTTLGYSAVQYGYIALLLGACWLAGNIANRLAFNISWQLKTTLSLATSLVAIALSVLYQAIFGLQIVAYIVPVGIIIFSLGMLFPLYLGKALLPFNHIAGIANATVFSGSWLVTAFISFMAALLPLSSAIALMLMFALLLVLVIGLKRGLD